MLPSSPWASGGHPDQGQELVDGGADIIPIRYDHVGVSPAGFDIFEVHGPRRIQVLPDDRIGGSRPFADIAQHPPDETDIGIRVDEDLDIQHRPQGGIRQHMEALDNDDRTRGQATGSGPPRVRGEIVDRDVDLLPRPQTHKVLDQGGRLEGIGVIVVDVRPVLDGEMAEIPIIRIMGYREHKLRTQSGTNFPYESGLTRPRAPRDPDDDRTILRSSKRAVPAVHAFPR